MTWEVLVEEILGKPESRRLMEMSGAEIVDAIKEDGGEHIIAVRNLTVPIEEGQIHLTPITLKRCPECGGRYEGVPSSIIVEYTCDECGNKFSETSRR